MILDSLSLYSKNAALNGSKLGKSLCHSTLTLKILTKPAAGRGRSSTDVGNTTEGTAGMV